MNIFVLDYNHELNAKYHNDKHVVKMILESAQMICTVLNDIGVETPYKSTHRNHPCTVWARESSENFFWLCNYMLSLHREWRSRFGHKKIHKSFESVNPIITKNFQKICTELPNTPMTPFKQAMPKECQQKDTVKAYRKYYMDHKQHLAEWKNGKPDWYFIKD